MFKRILFFVVLSLGIVYAPTLAWALSLDEAKAQGLVGEQPDGYLGMVQNTPEVQRLVTDINAKRRTEYQNIAKKNGTALNVVEALAAKKAIEQTRPGNYIRLPSGEWRKK